jgi:hypothetical protein
MIFFANQGIRQTLQLKSDLVAEASYVDLAFNLAGADPEIIKGVIRPMLPHITIRRLKIEGGAIIHAGIGVSAETNAPRTVRVSSDHPELLSLPASVTVGVSERVVSVEIQSLPVPKLTKVTITASFNSATTTKVVTLSPEIAVRSVSVPPVAYTGANLLVTASLAAAAPYGGSEFIVTSDDLPVQPTRFFVPYGSTKGDCYINVPNITSAISGTILIQHATTKISKPCEFRPNEVTGLTISPVTIKGGVNRPKVNGTVTVGTPFDGVVSLQSSDPLIVSVPATVQVSRSALSTTFPIQHYAVTEKKTVTIND